ncbi:acetate/propionate family kinase [uncultured Bartonella sp.]|uniref:acetate/propionate family kinase n=1 Tax=uncultured Bartonella sp. TaxID=104108 RepID=UPI00261D5849|nr:acetate/propionate family kinase [uncultured Bartonella sp.]
MNDRILTFNSGSSSLKIGLYENNDGHAERLGKGSIDLRRNCFSFRIEKTGEQVAAAPLPEKADDKEMLKQVFGWLVQKMEIGNIKVVGHRIVHGADIFRSACIINDKTLDYMESLIPLAPLHQPANLRLVYLVKKLYPELIQTASFDTAFHQGQSDRVRRFAIPRILHNRGIKKYGFHGLSYQYIAEQLPKLPKDVKIQNVVVAHLGSGASLCALKNLESTETTMSFTTLDGVPMATRCGALDAGVMIHLLRDNRHRVSDIEYMLYHSSGLLGMSGISADCRDLVASKLKQAKQALDVFNLRIAQEIARLAVTLQGLDSIIFTAGIGEHQPEIREAVLEQLRWMGIEIDYAANNANKPRLTTMNSRIAALIIPTDEEQRIADDAARLITEKPLNMENGESA